VLQDAPAERAVVVNRKLPLWMVLLREPVAGWGVLASPAERMTWTYSVLAGAVFFVAMAWVPLS
jgi:hypothetical protein